MIHGILIHSSKNVNSVFFAHMYTGEGNDEQSGTRQQAIVRKVFQDVSFQQQAASHYPTRLDLRTIPSSTINGLTTSKKVSETYPQSSDQAVSTSPLPIPNEGIVFLQNLVAIWHQFGDILFSVVCDLHTGNFALISNTISLITEHICRRFGVNRLEKSILEQPDEVEHIVQSYIQGPPILVNCSLHRCMIKSEDGHRPFLD